MDIYERLDVTKIINAAGYKTVSGGSLMPDEVLEAMNEAARHFVDIRELQLRAGERIAKLTRNEAAYISCGAAASLQVAAAACMTRGETIQISRLPNVERNEILIHRNHRNPYELGLLGIGARIVDFGFVNQTSREELEAAISPRSAAVFFFFFRGGHKIREGCLSLEETVEVAHGHGLPVVVDAASQIPPVSSLWEFTQRGADMVVFSGGKGLRGPQSTGLIVGKRELIAVCNKVGAPNYTALRPLKVQKESMAGLVAAVECAVRRDEAHEHAVCEETVRVVVEALAGTAGITAVRSYPSDSGQPVPVAAVRFSGPNPLKLRNEAIRLLRNGRPAIVVRTHELDSIALDPLTLTPVQAPEVARRIREVAGELKLGV
ncbi:MAG: aminotransferase class V-fold PLP-dependent enzyme [Bacillota bacterium]|nr:aminotransferase class V-fold PLP-dependent enzyme [Bacillota bacterium]